MIGLKGNGLEVNILTGMTVVHGKEMTTKKFKEMCFKNGWEGTLYKVTSLEKAFTEAVREAFKKLRELK